MKLLAWELDLLPLKSLSLHFGLMEVKFSSMGILFFWKKNELSWK